MEFFLIFFWLFFLDFLFLITENFHFFSRIGQFSGMFMNQMAGGGGGAPGAAPGGLPPNIGDLLGGLGMTPEQLQAQMAGLFGGGGAAPPGAPPGSQAPPKGPEDKDKKDKDPPPPSYFSWKHTTISNQLLRWNFSFFRKSNLSSVMRNNFKLPFQAFDKKQKKQEKQNKK